MYLNDIVSRFQSPKPNGNSSFMVKCPCHNDNQQSLSITEQNGKILINCFAGCSTEDIVNAIGLEMKDLFMDKPDCTAPKPPEVEYIYTDSLKKSAITSGTTDIGKSGFIGCTGAKAENGKQEKEILTYLYINKICFQMFRRVKQFTL